MRSLARGIAGALCLVALVGPREALADEKQACVDASDQAQKLRDDHKLTKAREQLLLCARDACPAIVKKDCTQWLSEVESSMSSIVVSARDASGRDYETGKVLLDGQPIASKFDGTAILVDPGPHVFRVEVEGRPPYEQQVVIREGEKNRAIAATFGSGDESGAGAPGASGGGVGAGAGGGSGGGEGPAVPGEGGGKGPPVAAVAIGAVGLVALGSFAYFGLTGKKDVSDLRDGCGQTHSCAQSDVDSARTKLIVADVSLAVGVVALGIATYLLVTHSSAPAKASISASARAPRFDVAPLPGGGGYARLGASF